jgi:hypothetical protein
VAFAGKAALFHVRSLISNGDQYPGAWLSVRKILLGDNK